MGSGLLTHRRNHCGSFASGPPRCTRSALVAELASPSKPRWRSGQLCAKRLSADSVLPRLSRRRGWGRLRRGAALPGAASAPCPVPDGSGRFAGTTQRFVQPGLVGRSRGSSVGQIITSPPIWPICVPVSKPATGMTRVVHYLFLGSAPMVPARGGMPQEPNPTVLKPVEEISCLPVNTRACSSTRHYRPTAIHSNAEVSPPCVTESHCKGVPAEPAKRICRSCPVQSDCLEVRCPRCQGRGSRRVNGRALTAEHRHRISHRRFLPN